MKEQYSIEEILKAVGDLQGLRKVEKLNDYKKKDTKIIAKSDIPADTLRLIQEAESTIKSKLQSG
tara:strand:- start:578 stop:772 length:195 start_codon:yes stop_codon:yes gene_type:complete